MKANNQLRKLNILRIIDDTKQAVQDDIIVEEAITLIVPQIGNFTLMCTPGEIKALVMGFLFTEGLIHSKHDVVAISDFNVKSNSIAVEVQPSEAAARSRNLIVTSSCGFCGAKNIERLLEDVGPCGNNLSLPCEQIFKLIDTLQAQQKLQQRTGSAHAAALFNAVGEFIAFAEDIGRHNAVDKVIGQALLQDSSLQSCGMVLSSRISFEMVAKAAKAGIELIIAISAPSTLAIKLAECWNITLCGFIRGHKANLYTCPERVQDRLALE